MKYLDLGLQRPDHGYSAPAVEQELVDLGFELLGWAGVDVHPDMEWARGDMADEDLAWIASEGRVSSIVFWHPTHHGFVEVSPWLDGQAVLSFRTPFDDGSIVRIY